MTSRERAQLPQGWKATNVESVITFFTGGTPFLKSEYSPAGTPVLTKGDVKPFGRIEHSGRFVETRHAVAKRYRFTEFGDLLVTTRDLTTAADFLGLVAPIPIDKQYLVNQGANVFRLNKDLVDTRYFLYWTAGVNYRNYIKSAVSGSTQIHIRKSDWLNAPLHLPPSGEQRRIARILGSFDDKIELNRRMNETLDAMARAIFQSWFVDFDPVRAKAGGEHAESICQRLGLTTELLALFPEEIEGSELGEVPLGWTLSTIGSLANIVGGSTPNTKEAKYWDRSVHYWATPKDLSRLSTPVLLGTERKVSDAGLAQISSGLLEPGTVLMSSRAPIGYRAINEVPVAINQGFIAMKPCPAVSRYFLLYWAEWAQDEIVSRANGSTFLEISKSNFRPIPVVRPSDALLAQFEQHIQPMYRRIVSNEREIQLLIEQRDALLPELLSGNLTVADVEVQP